MVKFIWLYDLFNWKWFGKKRGLKDDFQVFGFFGIITEKDKINQIC